MKHLSVAVPLIFISGLVAQTVETIPYRAVLLSTNEVPAGSVVASGAATVWLHVVRDSAGKVVSGSADANVSYKFPAAVSITAMHIHAAPAGTNGGIVVPFAITRTDDATGVGNLPPIQTQFPTTAVTLDTINGIIANPSQFYFNVHTTDAPGGAMRGQLQPATMIVQMGRLSPLNETPPITGQTWSAISTITSLITRDAAGKPTSALVTFDTTYSGFPDDTTFTGHHIHLGGIGVAGPVTINTGLRNLAATAGGGSLHFDVEADVTSQAVVDTLNSIQFNPSNAYVNLHTTVAAGGAVRSPLLTTDKMNFQITMSSANEVPAITPTVTAPASINVYTVRNADGTAAAGTVVFDTNPRLAAGSTVTAMHIHDQVAGQNGPVTIDSGLTTSPILIADGTGNITRVAQVKTATALASLNSLIVNPEKHYANMHTTASPGGVVRSQLAAANTATPAINYTESAVQDPRITTLAPGELAFINGTNFAKIGTDLGGFNAATAYPKALNGVSVTIGGVAAPIWTVSGERVFAQVPFEVPAGPQPVVVTNANGASAPFSMNIAAAAPAIFFYDTGAVAFRLTDFALITPANPAAAGDTIGVFATGLGQTTPAQKTGDITPNSIFLTGAVTAKIGGKDSPAVQGGALPGFVGVYLVLVTVPPGVPAGNASLQISMGSATSNSTTIAVK